MKTLIPKLIDVLEERHNQFWRPEDTCQKYASMRAHILSLIGYREQGKV